MGGVLEFCASFLGEVFENVLGFWTKSLKVFWKWVRFWVGFGWVLDGFWVGFGWILGEF